jgi:hypothetical protein
MGIAEWASPILVGGGRSLTTDGEVLPFRKDSGKHVVLGCWYEPIRNS